jgi:hypothetical protein
MRLRSGNPYVSGGGDDEAISWAAAIATCVAGWLIDGAVPTAQQTPNPRQQPGAMVHIFAPEQHDLYDGHFVISANRIHKVGGLNDPEGWDHLDNDAKSVRPVTGSQVFLHFFGMEITWK